MQLLFFCLVACLGLCYCSKLMYGKNNRDSQTKTNVDSGGATSSTKDTKYGEDMTSGHSSSGKNGKKDKIFTFAFCGESRPFHFIDETGRLTGFTVDILMEACEIAGKICSNIYVRNVTECWDGMAMRSIGLQDRWYDAVADMQDTMNRMLTHSFVAHYGREPAAYLYAHRTSTLSKYDGQSNTIGFVKGNWLDKHCLESMSIMPSDYVTKDSYHDLMTALDRSQVNLRGNDESSTRGPGTMIDVAFMEERVANGYKKVSEKISCSKMGTSFMSRKDMMYELYWLSDSLKKLYKNGKYHRMCYIASKAYG